MKWLVFFILEPGLVFLPFDFLLFRYFLEEKNVIIIFFTIFKEIILVCLTFGMFDL